MAKALQEPTFWILTALVGQARHGYGVIQAVSQLSDGQVTLQAGTLYAALDRLCAIGLVEVDRDEKVDGRDRRYYRLTKAGVSVLEAEAVRLRRNAETAAALLAGRRRPNLRPSTS